MTDNHNAVIMSGPHEGARVTLSPSWPHAFAMPHPDVSGVHSRYSRNDGDDLVEGLIQLHYIGDVPSSSLA